MLLSPCSRTPLFNELVSPYFPRIFFHLIYLSFLAEALSFRNEWSASVLAQAADSIAEYGKATATGAALREMANDLRLEIIRQTHRVEMAMRHIEMLSAEYTSVYDRLGAPLPPLNDVPSSTD